MGWSLSTTVTPNDLGLSCASNMLSLGREVQAERHSSLAAYRDSSKLLLAGVCVTFEKSLQIGTLLTLMQSNRANAAPE